MASKPVADGEKKAFILSQEDIPGANLPRETVEECSVVQLKRWLVCRGAKTTGKKGALVNRYAVKIKCLAVLCYFSGYVIQLD